MFSLALVQTGQAGQNFYINNDVVTNPGNIDATNFINNNSFSVAYGFLYETTDTLNYTNNATMTSSGGGTTVSGFQFDTLSGGNRFMASSFYNPGSILISSPGAAIVNATNLASPGLIDVGANGLLQLTGQNVDLSYATLTIEPATFAPGGTGSFGTDTNADWDPSVALTAISAYSSLPNEFIASPSVPYFQTPPDKVGTNVVIYRSIFLSNITNANVTAQAFFGQISVGNGTATVEWTGVYTNPATGLQKTNYLILNDNYVLGASTNITFNNGIPDNFAFSTDPTTLAGTTPATAGFQSVFFPGVITNAYSYALVKVVPTSVSTGSTASNPSGALTNLPARTQISAGRELNLALSTITGQNYTSLTCTNQFDGNVGAQIISPYSDINLGVTNGFITVSNLLQSVIPAWNGTIQLWSTEFFYTDTNSGFAVTNDYRVLIVSNDLSPFSSPMVQNLTLHGTNLVISDVLNISSSLSIDAQSLTLTTNVGYPNNGAGSPDGELNLENQNVFFASSLPNLLWLTNNGKISTENSANFGGPSPANYQTFINNGTVSDYGSAICASYFQNGGKIYSGSGSFNLQSQSTVLTGGSIANSGDISIVTGSLLASNVVLQSGRSLVLQATNLLTDGVLPNAALYNGNQWFVGASSLVALNLPILPAAGDLLGTTIYETALTNQNIANTWAGQDRGVSSSGYLNDVAVGRLVLNALAVPPHSKFTFTGAGSSNALYVDTLILSNNAATLNFASSNVTSLAINTNLVIYYAQALSNGLPVSGVINGWNTNHLRWVSGYQGLFNSTNIVVTQPSVSSGPFQLSVSGVQLPSGFVTGSSYKVIIQSATNLNLPNWANVYTGTPPFTFINQNYLTNQQQFYRAKQGW
jgi:hypothetical protein